MTKMFVKQPLASPGSANNLYSYKIDYAAQVYDILNFNKYQSCILGSTVTAILMDQVVEFIGKGFHLGTLFVNQNLLDFW